MFDVLGPTGSCTRRFWLRARRVLALLLGVGLLSAAPALGAEPGGSFPSDSAQALALSSPGYCVAANPSCGRDPWWLQFNELQGSGLARFDLTGLPLTVEERYMEAVHLLWAWDEGQSLLRDGSEFGVVIQSGVFEREPTAIASYTTSRRQIQINPRYARAATWMLAAVLAHELRHISDAHRRLVQGHVTEQCFARETRAYETETRFIAWYTNEMVRERVPMRELQRQAPPDVRTLAELLVRISSAPDASELVRKDYAEACTRNP